MKTNCEIFVFVSGEFINTDYFMDIVDLNNKMPQTALCFTPLKSLALRSFYRREILTLFCERRK